KGTPRSGACLKERLDRELNSGTRNSTSLDLSLTQIPVHPDPHGGPRTCQVPHEGITGRDLPVNHCVNTGMLWYLSLVEWLEHSTVAAISRPPSITDSLND
ncbi:hypothetical protein CH063_05818, partial [Colletotrichum higginsianum]